MISLTEKLRRAVAEAHRATDTAATAAWRAKRKVDVVRELALEVTRSSAAPDTTRAALNAFLQNESARLVNEATGFELAGYDRRSDLSALADFMGAKD